MRIHVKRSCVGFSLLEVLVSLCILSLGVIGVAAMQITAIHTTQHATFHSMALQLATEVADQLRNHPDEVSEMLLELDFETDDQIAVASQCWGNDGGCDSVKMAIFASHEAQRRIKAFLPKGHIKVCRDASPWDEQKAAYAWDCDESNRDAPIVVKVGWRDPADSKPIGKQSMLTPKLVLQVQS